MYKVRVLSSSDGQDLCYPFEVNDIMWRNESTIVLTDKEGIEHTIVVGGAWLHIEFQNEFQKEVGKNEGKGTY